MGSQQYRTFRQETFCKAVIGEDRENKKKTVKLKLWNLVIRPSTEGCGLRLYFIALFGSNGVEQSGSTTTELVLRSELGVMLIYF